MIIYELILCNLTYTKKPGHFSRHPGFSTHNPQGEKNVYHQSTPSYAVKTNVQR